MTLRTDSTWRRGWPARPLAGVDRPAPGRAGRVLACLLLVGLGTGCERRAPPAALPGYVEGDWVYVAAPVAGALRELSVSKGTTVAAGAPLFSLDPEPEASACAEAQERCRAIAARLENLRKGQRPSEVAAVEARLAAARAAAALSTLEKERATQLGERGVVAQAVVDQARSQSDRDQALIRQIEADVVTATLGARPDDIRAAEADAAAAEAARVQAQWRLEQKRQVAPAAGLVQDTLFRLGEWVPAGAPVIMLLPPGNIKVRVYVPEPLAASVAPGRRLSVHADGMPERSAVVSFVSAQAEYTPPVLYSRDNRAKLVFLVEAVLAPAADGDGTAPSSWKPGVPVDVRFADP